MLRARDLSRSIAMVAARTPTLPPATHTNSYAIGAREVVLVEPATPYEAEQRAWIEWARGLASEGRRPVAILATHHHPDHVGGIDVLAAELDLPVWAHAETAARVPHADVRRRLADGDEIVLDGPIPERWQVLHTPGHAWGHVCLWDEDSRTAIVGDMVASVGTILIAPGDGDMAVYLAQLERLAGLGARLALAGPRRADRRADRPLPSLRDPPPRSRSEGARGRPTAARTRPHARRAPPPRLRRHPDRPLAHRELEPRVAPHEARARRSRDRARRSLDASYAGSERVMNRPWEVDFVAVSVALGESMLAIAEALGPAGMQRAEPIVRTLQARTKTARAIVLATALAEVFAELERMEMR